MRIDLIFVLISALSSGVKSIIFYFIPERISWSDAQAYCRHNYTDLATVADQADLDDLLKRVPVHLNEYMWIGLHRKNATEPWIWSDQGPFMYSAWAPRQPNNAGGNQFCVYTSPTGWWNDWTCQDTFAFICYDMKKQTVRLEVKSSLNVNDPSRQSEILAKVEQMLKQNGLTEEAKVSWKTKPGGNVFQRVWYQKSNVSNASCTRKQN